MLQLGSAHRVMLGMNMAKDFHCAIGQVRKYTNEPYYTHPWAVAALVGREMSDEDVIIAAALHDVREDVPGKAPIGPCKEPFQLVNIDAVIRDAFGRYVLGLVIELTHVYTKEDYPDQNRKWRKSREAERLSLVSEEARFIKTCDNLHNLRDLVRHDSEFASVIAGEMLEYFDSLPVSDAKMELGKLLETVK